MKYLFFLIIAAFFVYPKQKEYICIRHIGPTDKTISSFIISKDKINKDSVSLSIFGKINFEIEDSHDYIVSEVVYEKIKTLLVSYNKKKQKRTGDFGQFQIYINGIKKYNYVLGAKKSIELFNLVHEGLENEKDVLELDSKFKSVVGTIEYGLLEPSCAKSSHERLRKCPQLRKEFP